MHLDIMVRSEDEDDLTTICRLRGRRDGRVRRLQGSLYDSNALVMPTVLSRSPLCSGFGKHGDSTMTTAIRYQTLIRVQGPSSGGECRIRTAAAAPTHPRDKAVGERGLVFRRSVELKTLPPNTSMRQQDVLPFLGGRRALARVEISYKRVRRDIRQPGCYARKTSLLYKHHRTSSSPRTRSA